MSNVSVSFFLYLHKDLSGEPDVWKLGKAITPYSAVRARQKYMWRTFELPHLYFGRPSHITTLEDVLKSELFDYSATKLINGSCQTELVKIPIENLLQVIGDIIEKRNLDVIKLEMPGPYTASKSSSCPYGIPTESKSHQHLLRIVKSKFGDSPEEEMIKLLFTPQRPDLFDEDN